MISNVHQKPKVGSLLAALGLGLGLGLAGCGGSATAPLNPTDGSLGAAVAGCDLTREGADAAWQAYRASRPFHAQEVAASEPDAKGCRTLVLSEPPPGTSLATFSDVHPALANLVPRQHPIGVDGFVEDFVGVLPAMSDEDLAELTSRLHISLFGTAYRARLAPISAKSTWKGALDVEVRPAELHQWVFGSDASFWPVDGGPRERADDLFDPSQTGVYLSSSPGIVLWSFPKKGDFTEQKANVHIFGVESDLVLGAVGDDDTVIVIGRERVAPVDVLPPLRFESVQILAKTPLSQLAQSYERTQVFAGPLASGKDWAPILLSPAIVDTEVGSVLNIADQLLKRWSEAMRISYEGFTYPGEPSGGPFAKPVSAELAAPVITFNWNTARTGAVTPLAGGKTLYWMNRTGAMNVSYLPGEKPDPRTQSYEDTARDYFARQADPHLVRAVQHAALFQAFRQLGVTTVDELSDLEDSIHPDPANDVLISSGTEAIQRLTRISDADLDAAAVRFAERDIGAIENPTEGQIQKTLAKFPADVRAQFQGQLRSKITEKWAEIGRRIKAERASEITAFARELKKRVLATKDDSAPRYIALTLVTGQLANAIMSDPTGFRNVGAEFAQPASRQRANEIAEACVFVKNSGLDQIKPDAWRDVIFALSDVDAVEAQFRKARNARATLSHVRTPSVVRSAAGEVGAHGGHNVGSEVPHTLTPVRTADLTRIAVSRSGVSVSATSVPVRLRAEALVAVPQRLPPVEVAQGSRPPAPPNVRDSGWARLPEQPSSGCGEGCVVLRKYAPDSATVSGTNLLRSRFQVDMDGTVTRAGSTQDIADLVVRSMARQARHGKPEPLTREFVLRDRHMTPDEAMAVADSLSSHLARTHLDAKAGFLVDKGSAALRESYDLAGATVSAPEKVGNTYVVTVTVPRKQGLFMRIFFKSPPPGRLGESSSLPAGSRTPQDLAAELRKRFGRDLLPELASDAQPISTDNEPAVERARHAGTTGHTF